MGRIATTEDVEGIGDEEDVGDEAENTRDGEDDAVDMLDSEIPETQTSKRKGKYVASLQEVHDAFDSVNTLRYSQPTHLQGTYYIPIPEVCVQPMYLLVQVNARV
jgi:cleavage and polyadenylation specificity factor subunit 2